MKKWIVGFLAGAFFCAAALVSLNALIDPFGIFGDKLLGWWAYNMTENPRTAKIGWLDQHHGDYDSYVIGCSKTSSFPTELLNAYFDARFYNMTMYGGSLYDAELTARYLLEQYGAKHIVVNMGLTELLSYTPSDGNDAKSRLHARLDGSGLLRFYGRYLFSNPEYAVNKLFAYWNDSYLVNANKVFLPQTGAYDKSLRDIAPVGALAGYLAAYPAFLTPQLDRTPDLDVEGCVGAVARIRDLCAAAGAELTVIVSPIYERELDCYMGEDLMRFFRSLAAVTDFWDFSGYHSVAAEPRYFYDSAHFRNAVGEMALARMAGDDSVWVPADFGHLVTAENAETRLAAYPAGPLILPEENEKTVPILLYHHISETERSSSAVSPETFYAHMNALKEAGYETVSLSDLIAFAERGVPLPEKPLVISFDDGYRCNLDYAAPILREFGMRAVINVIGVSDGRDTYKDTDIPITPHFSLAEAAPWVAEGVIEIQSHSFDLHRSETLDADDYRPGALRKRGETEAAYIAAFRADFEASRDAIRKALETPVAAYAYPFGFYDDLTEVLLSELGVRITLTVNEGAATVVRGLPQSLRALERCHVTEEYTPEGLIAYLKGLTEQ